MRLLPARARLLRSGLAFASAWPPWHLLHQLRHLRLLQNCPAGPHPRAACAAVSCVCSQREAHAWPRRRPSAAAERAAPPQRRPSLARRRGSRGRTSPAAGAHCECLCARRQSAPEHGVPSESPVHRYTAQGRVVDRRLNTLGFAVQTYRQLHQFGCHETLHLVPGAGAADGRRRSEWNVRVPARTSTNTNTLEA